MAAFDTMVLLTYTLPPDALARGYARWLRAVDNPFFNAVPGMGLYENWRNVECRPDRQAFAHFDFLHPASEADLERVWFAPDLDAFRRGWVRKWGYGAAGAAPAVAANSRGWLARRDGDPAPRRGAWCVIAGDAPDAAGGERWRILAGLRKHYAIGAAPAGESWRAEIAPGEGPGFTRFAVHFAADEGEARALADRLDTRPLILATAMASPLLPQPDAA